MRASGRAAGVVVGGALVAGVVWAAGCAQVLGLNRLETRDADNDGPSRLVDAPLDSVPDTPPSRDGGVRDARRDGSQHVADARGEAAADAGFSTYRTTILGDHPVGYWRLGDHAPAVAVDETDAHPGTYQLGTATGYPGAIANDPNTAASFDGGDIVVGDAFPFTDDGGRAPYSLELWAKLRPGKDCFAGILGRTSVIACGPGDGYLMYNNCTDAGLEPTAFRQGSSCDSGAHSLAGPITAYEQWTHIVVTWDGTTQVLYESGQSTASGTAPAIALAMGTELLIGGSGAGPNWWGALDEVAIYDYALSPTQVCTHHSVGIGHAPC